MGAEKLSPDDPRLINPYQDREGATEGVTKRGPERQEETIDLSDERVRRAGERMVSEAQGGVAELGRRGAAAVEAAGSEVSVDARKELDQIHLEAVRAEQKLSSELNAAWKRLRQAQAESAKYGRLSGFFGKGKADRAIAREELHGAEAQYQQLVEGNQDSKAVRMHQLQQEIATLQAKQERFKGPRALLQTAKEKFMFFGEEMSKLDSLVEQYEGLRAEVIADNTELMLQTRITEIDMEVESKKDDELWMVKLHRSLGDVNLRTVTGWNPDNKYLKMVAKGVNARMFVNAAIMGAGLGVGYVGGLGMAGLGAAALTRRLLGGAFGGIAAVDGVGQAASAMREKGMQKKYAEKDDTGNVTSYDFSRAESKQELLQDAAKLESYAILNGISLEGSKVYRQLMDEVGRRAAAERSPEQTEATADAMEGRIRELMQENDRVREDQMRSDEKKMRAWKLVAGIGMSTFIGSGAMAEVMSFVKDVGLDAAVAAFEAVKGAAQDVGRVAVDVALRLVGGSAAYAAELPEEALGVDDSTISGPDLDIPRTAVEGGIGRSDLDAVVDHGEGVDEEDIRPRIAPVRKFEGPVDGGATVEEEVPVRIGPKDAVARPTPEAPRAPVEAAPVVEVPAEVPIHIPQPTVDIPPDATTRLSEMGFSVHDGGLYQGDTPVAKFYLTADQLRTMGLDPSDATKSIQAITSGETVLFRVVNVSGEVQMYRGSTADELLRSMKESYVATTAEPVKVSDFAAVEGEEEFEIKETVKSPKEVDPEPGAEAKSPAEEPDPFKEERGREGRDRGRKIPRTPREIGRRFVRGVRALDDGFNKGLDAALPTGGDGTAGTTNAASSFAAREGLGGKAAPIQPIEQQAANPFAARDAVQGRTVVTPPPETVRPVIAPTPAPEQPPANPWAARDAAQVRPIAEPTGPVPVETTATPPLTPPEVATRMSKGEYLKTASDMLTTIPERDGVAPVFQSGDLTISLGENGHLYASIERVAIGVFGGEGAPIDLGTADAPNEANIAIVSDHAAEDWSKIQRAVEAAPTEKEGVTGPSTGVADAATAEEVAKPKEAIVDGTSAPLRTEAGARAVAPTAEPVRPVVEPMGTGGARGGMLPTETVRPVSGSAPVPEQTPANPWAARGAAQAPPPAEVPRPLPRPEGLVVAEDATSVDDRELDFEDELEEAETATRESLTVSRDELLADLEHGADLDTGRVRVSFETDSRGGITDVGVSKLLPKSETNSYIGDVSKETLRHYDIHWTQARGDVQVYASLIDTQKYLEQQGIGGRHLDAIKDEIQEQKRLIIQRHGHILVADPKFGAPSTAQLYYQGVHDPQGGRLEPSQTRYAANHPRETRSVHIPQKADQ